MSCRTEKSRRTKRVTYVFDSSDSEFVEENTKSKKRKRSEVKASNARPNSEELVVSMHALSLHTIKKPKPLRQSLLDWYGGVHEKRGMPWRKPYDKSLDKPALSQRAYEVWISEIMLQQTQVATVIPYYNRWMERYPTIRDLAASDIETVNGLWKGLGYYSRAARLLSGAQKIVQEYGGLFPDSAKDMISNIPGIGRYSAGAISSIAYGHCEPVLDGNVNRLLSRILALHANPKSKTTLDILWAGATAMVDGSDRPGDVNQALIELGSTICKVREPSCKECPLSEHCNAYLATKGPTPSLETDIEELCSICEPVLTSEDSGVTKYPMKVERKKAREEIDLVNVVEWCGPQNERHFLLARRPETGLLAGLHEFPTVSDVQDCSTAAAAKKLGLKVLDQLLVHPPLSSTAPNSSDSSVIRVLKVTPAGDILHIFSHIRKTYRIQWILLEGGDEPPALQADYLVIDQGERVEKRQKVKKKVKASAKQPDSREGILRWVTYEDVPQANIGTGVMKVWKKVCELWET